MTSTYQETKFQNQIKQALKEVKKILDNTRHPEIASDVHHVYQDKYQLTETMTSTTVASLFRCFSLLGLTEETLQTLLSWAKDRSVTLRFTGEETCKYLREETRTEKGKTSHVTKVAGITVKSGVETKITEYFWQFDVSYELFAYKGTDTKERLVFQGRSGQVELKTTTKTSPKPKAHVIPAKDVNITWLLHQVSPKTQRVEFRIDRDHEKCHTPRRNEDVKKAMEELTALSSWSRNISSYFTSYLFPIQPKHEELKLSDIHARELFVPVLPLLEEGTGRNEENDAKKASNALVSLAPMETDSKVSLSLGDIQLFLAHQAESIESKFNALARTFEDVTKLITVAEAQIVVLTLHIHDIVERNNQCMDFVEDMLRKQLISAIGKIVTPVDFAEYMRFHNRRLYKEVFQPKPFCHAIRRPDHYPEGTLSIEAALKDGSIPEPILTISRCLPETMTGTMSFPLSAASNVTFHGTRHLHGWIGHAFGPSGEGGMSLSLCARARQFSSFILLVGRIPAANVFEPKGAIIVQNKDDLKIPLMLEQIPTPKEFKDAIESLSPEQQRFAKAFRSMQLSSTLFGLCVIQIKPQLEKVLKLPNTSLTKEIKLTQDLLELFIKYQIPPDQLTYDGNPEASVHDKVQAVKGYVDGMKSMIDDIQKEILVQKAKEKALQQLEDDRKPRSIPQPTFGISSGFRGRMGSNAMPPPCPPPCASAGPPMLMACSMAAPGGGGPPPQPMAMKVSDCIADPSPAPTTSTTTTAPSTGKTDRTTASESYKEKDEETEETSTTFDVTKLPGQLDQQYEALDEDNALRPTIIKIGKTWNKTSLANILAKPTQTSLTKSTQKTEKNRAFDLLDALTKSGCLSVDEASLHVMVAATHCFEKSLMDTIIQDNMNPIEKVERSSLIMATTIHDCDAETLVKPSELDRVKTFSAGNMFS